MFDLKIHLIDHEDNLKSFVIHTYEDHEFGQFVADTLDDVVYMLKHCCTHSNVFPHFTFIEVIQACTFFTDEEREYCILKYA